MLTELLEAKERDEMFFQVARELFFSFINTEKRVEETRRKKLTKSHNTLRVCK
jgi:hypothetical protein